jgi:hypothetical protein
VRVGARGGEGGAGRLIGAANDVDEAPAGRRGDSKTVAIRRRRGKVADPWKTKKAQDATGTTTPGVRC